MKKPTAEEVKIQSGRDALLAQTGFAYIGFRPMGNQVALLLTDDDLIVLGSANAPKEAPKKKESILQTSAGKPKIFKGKEMEKAEAEKDKDNRTFTVAAVAIDLVGKLGSPEVGDEISLAAGTMIEVKVDGRFYGVVPAHRLLCVHKEKIN